MKNLSFIFILFLFITISCEKYTEGICEKHEHFNVSSSKPLEYASLEDMMSAINSNNSNVKSTGFISYAETVMQEDGYDDLPWSINSESFASILNVDGEVIFNDTFLKLCHYGVIYAPISKIDKARLYASYETCQDLVTLSLNVPSYISKDNETYSFIEDSDILVFDAFGIVLGINNYSADTKVLAPDNKDLKFRK